MNKTETILLILTSLGLGTLTTFMALSMLPDNLQLIYILFKIYLFCIAPIILLIFVRRTQNASTS